MLFEAHRGVSTDYPENTLAAFRAAADLGYDMVELDPGYTADGVICVLHDEGELAEATALGADALAEYRSWFGGQAPSVAFPARVERFTKGLALGGRKYVDEVARSAGFAVGRPAFVPCPGERGEVYALRGPRRVTA